MINDTMGTIPIQVEVRKQAEAEIEEKALTVVIPSGLLQITDQTYLSNPTIAKEKWNNEPKEVITYTPNTPNRPELTIAYTEGLQNTDTFKIATQLYAYANDIGVKDTSDQPIDFNLFLDWLKYKRNKYNTHKIENKKKIWRAIYSASKTDLRTQFTYLVKKTRGRGKSEKYVFDKPLISDLIGVYRANGKTFETKDYQETPPDKIVVRFVDFFITQLRGKLLPSGEWIPKDATITPKIEAGLWKKKYQGNAETLLNYIFHQLKVSHNISGIRNYRTDELIKRATNLKRKDKAINRLANYLNLFKTDKHIKKWGFRETLKSNPLTDRYKKCPFVWIDFTGTAVFKRLGDFRSKPDSTKKIKELEELVHQQGKQVKALEDKNKFYGV
jgi:hypothetical protein